MRALFLLELASPVLLSIFLRLNHDGFQSHSISSQSQKLLPFCLPSPAPGTGITGLARAVTQKVRMRTETGCGYLRKNIRTGRAAPASYAC